jgi:hypothetical protein
MEDNMLKIAEEKKKEMIILIQGGLSTKSIILILQSEIDELKKQGFPLPDIALMIAQAFKLDLKLASLVKSMNGCRKSESIEFLSGGDYEEEASEWFIEDKENGMHIFRFDTGEDNGQF